MAIADNIPLESMPLPVKKSGNRLVVIALAVVIVLLLGACGYLWMSLSKLQAKAAPVAAHAVEAKPKPIELYAQLDPAFVVNFKDDDATRYLQVGVTVMAHDPAVIQAIKDTDPVVRNALVMLFSSQTYAQLSDTAGKQKLQDQALAAIRKIVADKVGKSGAVDALYFTSFVMQ